MTNYSAEQQQIRLELIRLALTNGSTTPVRDAATFYDFIIGNEATK